MHFYWASLLGIFLLLKEVLGDVTLTDLDPDASGIPELRPPFTTGIL